MDIACDGIKELWARRASATRGGNNVSRARLRHRLEVKGSKEKRSIYKVKSRVRVRVTGSRGSGRRVPKFRHRKASNTTLSIVPLRVNETQLIREDAPHEVHVDTMQLTGPVQL